jgi:hypothetical protein
VDNKLKFKVSYIFYLRMFIFNLIKIGSWICPSFFWYVARWAAYQKKEGGNYIWFETGKFYWSLKYSEQTLLSSMVWFIVFDKENSLKRNTWWCIYIS